MPRVPLGDYQLLVEGAEYTAMLLGVCRGGGGGGGGGGGVRGIEQ